MSHSSAIDVLDRVLDKGIVIDAVVRISLAGIDLASMEARVVVASIDTYLKYAQPERTTPRAIRPMQAPTGGEPGQECADPAPELAASS